MTDQLAWGLIKTIQEASKLTQQQLPNNVIFRLWMGGCELTDSGANAIGQAMAKNTVLTVRSIS